MSSGTRWNSAAGPERGREYDAEFAQLASTGADVHGEATLCASLVPAGARILDAGCGTGRVALRLAELGYRCVGMDNDPSMLGVARAASSPVTWYEGDLADLDDRVGEFDLVVAAGNVIPFLAAGTEAAVVARLAERLEPAGRLVTGFGLDAAHLPLIEAPFTLADYDGWCIAAGLGVEGRFATWDRLPYDDGGYAVTIHRRADRPAAAPG
jgi:SAM-dependent methyltransferase